MSVLKVIVISIIGTIMMVVGFSLIAGKPVYVSSIMHTPITNTQYYCVFETKDAYYEYIQGGTDE
jgi:hypothetical protein